MVFWKADKLVSCYVSASMPNSCICCGRTKGKGDKVSMFRFPADEKKRKQWMETINLAEGNITEHSRVCSRHFLHGDPSNPPSLDLGKRFASPKKVSTERGMRAIKRTQSRSFPVSIAKAKRATTPSSCASSVS